MSDKKENREKPRKKRLIQEDRNLPTLNLKIPMPETKPPKKVKSSNKGETSQQKEK